MNLRPRHGLLASASTLCALGLACIPAHAVLGGDLSTIETDRAALSASHRSMRSAAPAVQIHELISPDGSSIREFAGPDGVVFAVRWSTRFKPRLDRLLGANATAYDAAVRRIAATPGIRRDVALEQDDLVVHASMHLNNHAGVAYLRSRMPRDVHAQDLR